MGVCPTRNGAVENVTEIGDEAVEVVVIQDRVEDVELVWVSVLEWVEVPLVEESFFVVLWSSP